MADAPVINPDWSPGSYSSIQITIGAFFRRIASGELALKLFRIERN